MKKIFISIIAIAFINIVPFCQSRWVNSYHTDQNAPKGRFIEHYDHGYLLTGRRNSLAPRYNWLIKTDINGDVLWEKTIGDGEYTGIFIWGIEMNSDKDIYLSGLTTIEDPYGYADPMLIKLNQCGEKEWCRIFPSVNHVDYGYDLCTTPDGGCAMILTYTGLDFINDRVCLARFADNGDFLWKKCYNASDTVAMDSEECTDLILTPDNGFLLTGWCYYANPGDTLGWTCPYYIKTDQDGNLEWETIAGFIPSIIGGQGRRTIISPDSNYYYSSIRHHYRDGTDAAALLKMDMQGNIVGCYDLAPPNEIGVLNDSKFINDSTLICSAAWGEEYNGFPKAVIIDTLGAIIDDAPLLNNDFMAIVQKTFDGKFLFYTQEYIEEESKFVNYFFKLNQQLESDTMYNAHFTYDSLCPYQVTTDTIVQDNCGLIVGDEEIIATPDKEKITISPNPAHSSFVIRSDFFVYNSSRILIVDMLGRQVFQFTTNPGMQEVSVNTNGWKKGLYLVNVSCDGKFIGSERIVVE